MGCWTSSGKAVAAVAAVAATGIAAGVAAGTVAAVVFAGIAAAAAVAGVVGVEIVAGVASVAAVDDGEVVAAQVAAQFVVVVGAQKSWYLISIPETAVAAVVEVEVEVAAAVVLLRGSQMPGRLEPPWESALCLPLQQPALVLRLQVPPMPPKKKNLV